MEAWLYQKFFEIEKSHWWFVAREQIVLSVARNAAGLRPGDKVLDFGCGTGGILAEFSREHDARGVDASPLALEFCRRRGLEKLYLLEDFQASKEQFDLVLLLDVIEHIEDDSAVLAAAAARLKPGGAVLVTVPAFPWLWSSHDTANHHKRRYVRAELRHKLMAAGLQPVLLSYYNTLLFPLALLDRAAARLRPGGTDPGLKLPPAMLNGALRRVFASERFFLKHVSMPFGLSLIAVARRISA